MTSPPMHLDADDRSRTRRHLGRVCCVIPPPVGGPGEGRPSYRDRMNHKLLDTWCTRELPVFLATAKRLTERGRRTTGLWPDGDTAVEQLLNTLRQAENLTVDPHDKFAQRKAGGQLATVCRSVIAEVIAAVVTRQAGSGDKEAG